MQQPFKQNKKDEMVSRSQMLAIAREHKLYITKSTIHRWANQPEFPLVRGIEGQSLLYSRDAFVVFLKRKLKRIQEDH